MATSEAIRAEIEEEKSKLAQQHQVEKELKAQKEGALETQLLRRQLDEAREHCRISRNRIQTEKFYIQGINEDRYGLYTPAHLATSGTRLTPKDSTQQPSVGSEMSCTEGIVKREYVWKIQGLAWLKEALSTTDEPEYAVTKDTFLVGPAEFDFVYHPGRGRLNSDVGDFHASLAIECLNDENASFRHKVFIQRNDSEFVQWGSEGRCDRVIEGLVAGPDVTSTGVATGIFGLSHEELLQSEWVHEDTLTVKFEVEVRPDTLTSFLPEKPPQVQVPASSLMSNFLSLLEDGCFSDVTFLVKGEVLKAHSQILAARSEVFKAELGSGMRESLTKEVTVTDSDPQVFKAMLRFLYSDEFSHIEASIKESTESGAKTASDTGGTDGAGKQKNAFSKLSFLQELLSVSHKYQVSRLSAWCEKKLCDQVSEGEVCWLLCQAHLLDAKALQEVCMKFIRDNFEKVSASEEFAKMISQWPELLLKLSLMGFGASASTAAAAQQNFQRKRKRESSPEA